MSCGPEENDLVLDTLSLEATKEYTKKMGRWRRRAIEVSGSALFWAIVTVMHSTREPLIHFSNWLKQKAKVSRHDILEMNAKAESRGKVSEMVNSKCEEISMEFWRLYFIQWNTQPHIDELSLDQLIPVKTLIFQCIAIHASQFRRRVVQKTHEYPMKLFRLIKAGPTFPCDTRKVVAAELCSLDSSDASSLETFTRKLLNDTIFREQLLHASRFGTFKTGHQELFTLLTLVDKYIKPDVSENERINKLLSMLGDHCPNANLELNLSI